MASITDESGRRRIIHIKVNGFQITEDHTNYVIEVQLDSVRWQAKRRFKEFHYLHETLSRDHAVEMKSVAKFPPKKAVGNLTVKFVQSRQTSLSLYLQSLVAAFDRLPVSLARFLLWEKYEIQGITGSLTEYLFEKGDLWLEKGYPFEFTVLQLYALNQRMKLPTPTCELGSSFKSDFGHLLDFVSRLQSVKVTGSSQPHGTSNLVPNSLPYDLSQFRQLLRLQMVQVNLDQLQGVEHLRHRLLTLAVSGSLHCIRQALLPDWPPHRPLSPNAPVFAACTSADFSNNSLAEIDSGIRLLPHLRRLRLRRNRICQLANLDQLQQLQELDMSFNAISRLESAHLLLGNLKELELAENRLTSLEGLSRLYGLVVLGLRANLISDLSEVAHLSGLPLLSRLTLAENPLTQLADYRVRALQLFDSRAAELALDGQPASPKELDTVAVLQAIRRSRQPTVTSATPALACPPPSPLAATAAAAPGSLERPPLQLQQPHQHHQSFNCRARLLACPRHHACGGLPVFVAAAAAFGSAPGHLIVREVTTADRVDDAEADADFDWPEFCIGAPGQSRRSQATSGSQSEGDPSISQSDSDQLFTASQSENDGQLTASQLENEGQPFASQSENEGQPIASQSENEGQPFASQSENEGQPFASQSENEGQPFASQSENEGQPFASQSENEGQPIANQSENERQPSASQSEDDRQPIASQSENKEESIVESQQSSGNQSKADVTPLKSQSNSLPSIIDQQSEAAQLTQGITGHEQQQASPHQPLRICLSSVLSAVPEGDSLGPPRQQQQQQQHALTIRFVIDESVAAVTLALPTSETASRLGNFLLAVARRRGTN